MVETAEEDEDAGDWVRRAAGRAVSLRIMFPSQGSGVLPARMWFSICRRYAPGGVASLGWPALRRPAMPGTLGVSGGAAFGATRSASCLAAYSPAVSKLVPRCPSTTPISVRLPLAV